MSTQDSVGKQKNGNGASRVWNPWWRRVAHTDQTEESSVQKNTEDLHDAASGENGERSSESGGDQ